MAYLLHLSQVPSVRRELVWIVVIFLAWQGVSILRAWHAEPRNHYLRLWTEAPGTWGFLNMEDVARSAFSAEDRHSFLHRLNEIHEGDDILLLEEIKDEYRNGLRGCEDINRDGIACNNDAPLFELSLDLDGTTTLTGLAVNRYFSLQQPAMPDHFIAFIAPPPPPKQKKEAEAEAEPFNILAAAEVVRKRLRNTGIITEEGKALLAKERAWRDEISTEVKKMAKKPAAFFTRDRSHSALLEQRNMYRQTSAFAAQIARNQDFEARMAQRDSKAFDRALERGFYEGERKRMVKSRLSQFGFRTRLAEERLQSGWGVRETLPSRDKPSRFKERLWAMKMDRDLPQGGGYNDL